MANELRSPSANASRSKQKSRVVVVGAGIGGLTAGALLAKRGYQVTIFDQAIVPGGCASTFKRHEGYIIESLQN
jgi:phytoene dehydrogenase-like protein